MTKNANEIVEAVKASVESAQLLGAGARIADIVYLPVSELYPHPENPRKDVGDVTELAASIKAKGIMQNLTVVPGHYEAGSREVIPGGYTVIIGHRRRAGSIEAGLEHVPCAIVDMTYEEQIMTMTVENVQRVDLTAFEQAGAFQLMMDLGATVDSISERTGFSKKTVKHRLEMAKLNAKTLKEVSERQITMADFEKLAQIKNIKKRNEVLQSIGTYNFNNNVTRAVKDELFGERLPAVLEALKSLGAKEMKSSEQYSGRFEYLDRIRVNEDRKEDKPIIPKKYHKEELFYSIDTWLCDVSVYKKKTKAEAVKRSKAEIEREKDIKERIQRLKMLTEIAATLRANFVMSLEMNSKNREKMLLGAVSVLEANAVGYMYSVGVKSILKFIGEKPADEYNLLSKQFRDTLVSKPQKMIPAMIFKSFENYAGNSYYDTPYNDYPTHRSNIWLDNEYDWLISLGYEMSDDERQLRDGTHEIFKVEGTK